jgi:hypothetical protein
MRLVGRNGSPCLHGMTLIVTAGLIPDDIMAGITTNIMQLLLLACISHLCQILLQWTGWLLEQ